MTDVVYRGVGNDNPAGGRLVLVETPDGDVIGPLRHVVKHSPSGYTWGYAGSGPADLALSLLTDALGEAAKCATCNGTRRVVFPTNAEDPVAFDPENPEHVRLAEYTEGPLTCWDCEGGTRRLPYQAFKFAFVARWPESWTIRRSEILAWLVTQETP